MKKKIITMAISVAVLFIVGCQTEQIGLVSKNAGMALGATLIATGKLEPEELKVAGEVIDIIKEKINKVNDGSLYTDALYADTSSYIQNESEIPQKYHSASILVAMWTLQGIDYVLDTKPKWKENEELALEFSQGFLTGMNMVLSSPTEGFKAKETKEVNEFIEMFEEELFKEKIEADTNDIEVK
ncbi:MAG: hypothetical protein ACOCWG_02055 [bacterium]